MSHLLRFYFPLKNALCTNLPHRLRGSNSITPPFAITSWHLGPCSPAAELHLQRCRLRWKFSLWAPIPACAEHLQLCLAVNHCRLIIARAQQSFTRWSHHLLPYPNALPPLPSPCLLQEPCLGNLPRGSFKRDTEVPHKVTSKVLFFFWIQLLNLASTVV